MTDLIPLEEIERLKKLDEAATPAPWSNDNGHGNIRGPEGGTPIIRFPPIVWGGVDGWQPKETVANAKLTAAARNALPSLLAAAECAHRQRVEIERLREENARLRNAIENAPSPDCNLIVFEGCEVCAVTPEALEELHAALNPEEPTP